MIRAISTNFFTGSLVCLLLLPIGNATADEPKLNRNARIGLGFQALTGTRPFDSDARLGASLSGVYEFALTPRFLIGLQLAGRYFPATHPIRALGYGVLLRHAFLDPDSLFRPTLSYGLLFQIVDLPGQKGSGTAHDTRLAVGVDSKALGLPLFFELAFHISHLRYFALPATDLSRVEFLLGTFFSW